MQRVFVQQFAAPVQDMIEVTFTALEWQEIGRNVISKTLKKLYNDFVELKYAHFNKCVSRGRLLYN